MQTVKEIQRQEQIHDHDVATVFVNKKDASNLSDHATLVELVTLVKHGDKNIRGKTIFIFFF